MDGIIVGLTVPFLGTLLGAACVFFMGKGLNERLQKALTGFAAGVMVAASVWSLLIPSIDLTGREGLGSVLPAAGGFLLGILFLLFLDTIVPHQHVDAAHSEGPHSRLSKRTKLIFAITLHNIPEGMAVGVALAAAIDESSYLSMAGAMALAIGIAIQNFPEGAIVSMPLRAGGGTRRKAFALGALSGIVEPAAAVVALLITESIVPAMPYVLSFAAGAMLYVVVEELIPETQQGSHSNVGTIGFSLGFVLMMILDVVLG